MSSSMDRFEILIRTWALLKCGGGQAVRRAGSIQCDAMTCIHRFIDTIIILPSRTQTVTVNTTYLATCITIVIVTIVPIIMPLAATSIQSVRNHARHCTAAAVARSSGGVPDPVEVPPPQQRPSRQSSMEPHRRVVTRRDDRIANMRNCMEVHEQHFPARSLSRVYAALYSLRSVLRPA